MLSIREFLNAIAQDLAASGTSSRELLALQFDRKTENVKVLVGREPHAANYPSLEHIFGMVAQTCEEDGICPEQLERITFFDTEINVECSSSRGDALYTYPIESLTLH
jgi:hypothetical protein